MNNHYQTAKWEAAKQIANIKDEAAIFAAVRACGIVGTWGSEDEAHVLQYVLDIQAGHDVRVCGKLYGKRLIYGCGMMYVAV